MIMMKPRERLTYLLNSLLGAAIGAVIGSVLGILAVQSSLDTNWSGATIGAQIGALLGGGGGVLTMLLSNRWQLQLARPLHGLMAGAASGAFIGGGYSLFLIVIVLAITAAASSNELWELLITGLTLTVIGILLGGLWGVIFSGVVMVTRFLRQQ